MKPDKSYEDRDKNVSRHDLGCGKSESLELGKYPEDTHEQ